MTVNKRVTNTAVAMPRGVALGAVLSLLVTLAGAMIVAALVNRETIEESAIGYGAMVILLLASLSGTWLAVNRVKRQRMIVCGLTGAAYYLSLLACTALFFGGQYTGMGVTALVILAGCGTVALMGLRGNGSGIKRQHKYRSR